MKRFEEKIWNEGEYTYKAAYGFVPNIHAYLHDDDEKRDCMIVLPGGGYCMCVPPEANIPAMEFFSRGMNVFVLTYTTDITFSVPLKKQPLFVPGYKQKKHSKHKTILLIFLVFEDSKNYN